MKIPKTVREFFARPALWCKGAAARLADGKGTGSNDPQAVSWCLASAVNLVYGDEKSSLIMQQLLAIINRDRTSRFESLEPWNDAPERKYKHVRQLICEADI